jgi:hypothetical protein
VNFDILIRIIIGVFTMQKNYLTNGDDRLFVKSPVDQQDFNDPVVFDLNTDFDFDFFVDDLVVSQVMIDAENNIFGFDGNDRIDAGFQNDTIYGGYGNDAISGGKSVVNLMSIDLSRTFFWVKIISVLKRFLVRFRRVFHLVVMILFMVVLVMIKYGGMKATTLLCQDKEMM